MVTKGIVDKAMIKPSDVVLEVGPGTGNMTLLLMVNLLYDNCTNPLKERAKKVISIELDQRMITELEKRVQETPFQDRLNVISGDVLKIDPLPYFEAHPIDFLSILLYRKYRV